MSMPVFILLLQDSAIRRARSRHGDQPFRLARPFEEGRLEIQGQARDTRCLPSSNGGEGGIISRGFCVWWLCARRLLVISGRALFLARGGRRDTANGFERAGFGFGCLKPLISRSRNGLWDASSSWAICVEALAGANSTFALVLVVFWQFSQWGYCAG